MKPIRWLFVLGVAGIGLAYLGLVLLDLDASDNEEAIKSLQEQVGAGLCREIGLKGLLYKLQRKGADDGGGHET